MPHRVVLCFAAVLVCEGFGLWGFARRGLLRDLGFRVSAPPLGYVLALITTAVWISAAWVIPAVRNWAFHFSMLKFLAVAAALMAGMFEEVFFRGFIMNAFQKAGRGKAMQVLASGMAFGLGHAVWGLPALFGGHGDISVFLRPVLSTTLGGIALAVIYLVSNRSLGPVMLSHFPTDAIIEPGLLIAAFLHR